MTFKMSNSDGRLRIAEIAALTAFCFHNPSLTPGRRFVSANLSCFP